MASVRHLGYFPYCLPTENPNFDWKWLCSADLQSSMALFWRVKKLRFFAEFNGEFGLEAYRPTTIETEKKLVCLRRDTDFWEKERYSSVVGEFEASMQPAWFSKAENKIYWFFDVFAVNDNEQRDFSIITKEDNRDYDFIDYKFGTDDRYSFRLAVVSGTTALEPQLKILEWWAYDPLDGLGPIYDTATGETLR